MNRRFYNGIYPQWIRTVRIDITLEISYTETDLVQVPIPGLEEVDFPQNSFINKLNHKEKRALRIGGFSRSPTHYRWNVMLESGLNSKIRLDWQQQVEYKMRYFDRKIAKILLY